MQRDRQRQQRRRRRRRRRRRTRDGDGERETARASSERATRARTAARMRRRDVLSEEEKKDGREMSPGPRLGRAQHVADGAPVGQSGAVTGPRVVGRGCLASRFGLLRPAKWRLGFAVVTSYWV
ncbi:hypothetical protein TEQG_06671 [Trichophyton equinum CBS 127.97]|uniref:Uncharacterized protein n=1 Tax=Trichophyton equinum (strain ATCC MYA-4606 / CBS 127.97) TaxID=559882 RepID=F2Q0M0_TRIEC|nr:hypothetical protein TEQG_06671 [Trichophyton equinum CBS 127.97]